jgi:hypothetical protein
MERGEATIFLALQLLSNVGYILPALRCYRLRAYRFMTYFIVVALASELHHLCFDGHLCPARVGRASESVDITAALFAGAMSLLFTVAYDPVKVQIDRQLPDSTQRIRVHYYRFQDHTYSQVVEILYLFLTLYLVLFFGGGLLTIGLLVALLLALILLNIALYWRFKVRTWRRRYNFHKLGIGALLAFLGSSIFGGQLLFGRLLHPVWHILTALSADLLIAGASGHIEDHEDGVQSVDLHMTA